MRCKKAIEVFSSAEVCGLLLVKWEVVEEMVRVLSSLYIATLCLQRQNCTLSDFFGFMIGIDIKLKKEVNSTVNKTKLAEILLVQINNRKKLLIENRLMVTALYMDPRYKCELKNDERKIMLAKMTLEKIHERIQKIKKSQRRIETNQTIDSLIEMDGLNGDETMESLLDDVDKYYQENFELDNATTGTQSIAAALDDYDEMTANTRVNSKENVLEFWKQKKDIISENLFELACIISAIPPTQSSIERLFSALNFIFSDRRCNLRQSLLEDILLIYSNSEFFYEVTNEEVEKLEINITVIIQ